MSLRAERVTKRTLTKLIKLSRSEELHDKVTGGFISSNNVVSTCLKHDRTVGFL